MALSLLALLSNPIMWMLAMMLVAGGSRIVRGESRNPAHESRIARVGNGAPEAVALLFLSTAYRPSIDFVAKTQIQQQEDADDDDQGGPDSPRKHYLRQMRRIRNGDPLDRIVWRLE
ncbi:MAG TPA: hypothetical protein VHZ28_12750 [Terracidiphilus sp.]|jgi:hypothetical protein|nr:hypothetical protein [Terracidiphilus sp.]